MSTQEANERLVQLNAELLQLKSDYAKKRNEMLADKKELEAIVRNQASGDKVTIMCLRNCYWDKESEYWSFSVIKKENLAKRIEHEEKIYFTNEVGVMSDMSQHYDALRYVTCGRTYKLTPQIRKMIVKQYRFTQDIREL